MKAMFLDLSVCIGCRACQVACREWNDLSATATRQTGSYQNPAGLSGDTWKMVKFIELPGRPEDPQGGPVWLFYSDSCKHCLEAPCLTACPTGAIYRNSEGMVLVSETVCNGNQHCVPACPFGVIGIHRERRVAQKCTFCVDRVGAGLEPACASVCPTDCIRFGEREELAGRARGRLEELRSRGKEKTRLYGLDEMGGLNVFYLLLDEPEAYGLPRDPLPPVRRLAPALLATAAAAAVFFAFSVFTLAGG